MNRLTALALLGWALSTVPAVAFPVSGDQTVLPAGSDFAEEAPDEPREVFHSEAIGGKRSYMVTLGDMAFSATSLLGDTARRAGLSCDTCHVNGANNSQLFVAHLSTVPGTFDTTGALFNPKADNGVLDPLTIPSLRGAHALAPYGHDGRFASLRDFVRNVIVNEFAGPEPSPAILDALVAYLQDIDFVPNKRLAPGGGLAAGASPAERHGEALFRKPFPGTAGLSCAACHVPDAAFIDHTQHDVGTGGFYKTPTLLNANGNAPYFHDGRFDSYAKVVSYFDGFYRLGLSAGDRADLTAYLGAVGDGQEADRPITLASRLAEVTRFVGVLDTALPAQDREATDLTVDTVDGELRDLVESFPDRKDTTVTGGLAERGKARLALKQAVLLLRRVALTADAGKFDEAVMDLATYRTAMTAAEPVLQAAVPWSFFDATTRRDHYAAMRQMLKIATGKVD